MHVTQVTLTIGTDEHGQVWRLDWSESNGSMWTKSHYSEGAARRHATGLCGKRPPGTTVQDIFTDKR